MNMMPTSRGCPDPEALWQPVHMHVGKPQCVGQPHHGQILAQPVQRMRHSLAGRALADMGQPAAQNGLTRPGEHPLASAKLGSVQGQLPQVRPEQSKATFILCPESVVWYESGRMLPATIFSASMELWGNPRGTGWTKRKARDSRPERALARAQWRSR